MASHDALVIQSGPKKLTMEDVTLMVDKLSPNDAAIIYNTFKFVNDLLNPTSNETYPLWPMVQ